MQRPVTIEGEVTEDGRLVAEIPKDAPRGRVLVTLAPTDLPAEELALTDEDLQGQGLSAAEIARSPEMGSWKGGEDVPNGAAYVESLRKSPPRYRW